MLYRKRTGVIWFRSALRQNGYKAFMYFAWRWREALPRMRIRAYYQTNFRLKRRKWSPHHCRTPYWLVLSLITFSTLRLLSPIVQNNNSDNDSGGEETDKKSWTKPFRATRPAIYVNPFRLHKLLHLKAVTENQIYPVCHRRQFNNNLFQQFGLRENTCPNWVFTLIRALPAIYRI